MYLLALIDLIVEGTPSFATELSAYLNERARQAPSTEGLAHALEEATHLACAPASAQRHS